MSFGVIILSLKRSSYSMGAFNLALSIKHYNPLIDITLVSDNQHQKYYREDHYKVFDSIKTISQYDFIDNGMFQPALAKININKYSHYDRTLYIDADSLVLQDLQPLFDKLNGQEFKGNIIEGYTQWTDAETFRSFFGVDFGNTINSSWFYFENNCRIFEQANKYYKQGFNPDKIMPKWGLSYPDELFFNAALAKLSIDPTVGFDVMFFGNLIDQRTRTELQNDFYTFTLYGGAQTVRLTYIEWYDSLCFMMCTARNTEHYFKGTEIVKHKHVQAK